MGKYTSIARILRNELEDAESREDKGSSQNNIYVNINNIDESIDSNLVDEASGSVTTLRPTTLTTLILDEKDKTDEKPLVVCIHNVESEECAVCSGYVRWLIEDDARLSAARSNPDATRERYRETIEGVPRHVEEC
jgi:hypothetical protein